MRLWLLLVGCARSDVVCISLVFKTKSTKPRYTTRTLLATRDTCVPRVNCKIAHTGQTHRHTYRYIYPEAELVSRLASRAAPGVYFLRY